MKKKNELPEMIVESFYCENCKPIRREDEFDTDSEDMGYCGKCEDYRNNEKAIRDITKFIEDEY